MIKTQSTVLNKIYVTKLFILIAIIFLLIALTGCGSAVSMKGSLFGTGKTADNVKIQDYRKGTEGIKLEFVESMPPEKVLVGDMFNFGIRLENKGAYDVDLAEGSLFLNFDSTMFLIEEDTRTQEFELLGRSAFVSDGEFTEIYYPALSRCFQQLKGNQKKNFSQTVVAIACYAYETHASADICFDPNSNKQSAKNEEKVCTQSAVSLSGGQGAPIAVTQISPEIVPYGNKIRAQIDIDLSIANSQGEVYLNEFIAECDDPKIQNKIFVEAEISGQNMHCKSLVNTFNEKPGTAVFRSGKSKIRCYTELNKEDGAFITPVTVTAKYNYKDKVHHKLMIAPPIGGVSDAVCTGLESEFKASLSSLE
ncbi:hypothetical protein HN587_06125 [Candidatus Woesearchaeota archaeon]|jgi:hypothetical protein|nr:hypothetical protein [Candidatus Woesearchaeota archaeon]